MEMPINLFKQEWRDWERARPMYSSLVKFSLWLRLFLFGLLDPLLALEGTIQALTLPSSSVGALTRGIAVVNALLCTAAFLNAQSDLTLLLYAAHVMVTSFLSQSLRLELTRTKIPDVCIQSGFVVVPE
ncbi:hypothetical protein BDN72DRAFT_260137 [Pluteus cervinus]|uniref:Uncharacterized protein n=1 Tax=Pluteus cervinus TaxID=181527 RepID=A0ACD3AGD3_9AGAR|nr:hypothetical protein BDN72DRAFT_260137 [Pluteus cervinus]